MSGGLNPEDSELDPTAPGTALSAWWAALRGVAGAPLLPVEAGARGSREKK